VGVRIEPPVLEVSEGFARLTDLAVLRATQILEPEPDLTDEKFTKIQAGTAMGVLQLQTKIDEGRLKRRKLDVLPKLLEMIREEKVRIKEQGLVIDHQPLDLGEQVK
jgi:hypothetical protein